jgi:hypothetical protein
MGLCFKLSNWELRIMRHELADHEWAAIRPILPNRPRDMPRANDRRVLNGIFLGLAIRRALFVSDGAAMYRELRKRGTSANRIGPPGGSARRADRRRALRNRERRVALTTSTGRYVRETREAPRAFNAARRRNHFPA